MNVSSMLPIGLLLSLSFTTVDVQAAGKNYECVVKDGAGKRLIHTAPGLLMGITTETYSVVAADAVTAEPVAVAAANSEHNNKAVSSCCIERAPMEKTYSQVEKAVGRPSSVREPANVLRHVGCGFPVSLVLSLGVSAAQAQTADRNYECAVKDSAGKRLLHTESGVFNATTETYLVTAADALAAEPVALAQANKEHSNKAVSACCAERTSTVQKKF